MMILFIALMCLTTLFMYAEAENHIGMEILQQLHSGRWDLMDAFAFCVKL